MIGRACLLSAFTLKALSIKQHIGRRMHWSFKAIENWSSTRKWAWPVPSICIIAHDGDGPSRWLTYMYNYLLQIDRCLGHLRLSFQKRLDSPRRVNTVTCLTLRKANLLHRVGILSCSSDWIDKCLSQIPYRNYETNAIMFSEV